MDVRNQGQDSKDASREGLQTFHGASAHLLDDWVKSAKAQPVLVVQEISYSVTLYPLLPIRLLLKLVYCLLRTLVWLIQVFRPWLQTEEPARSKDNGGMSNGL